MSAASPQISDAELLSQIHDLEQRAAASSTERQQTEASLRNLGLHREHMLNQGVRTLREGLPSEDAAISKDPLMARLEAFAQSQTDASVQKLLSAVSDRLLQQEGRLKKMAFELEMELGHVNLLRSENQSLKKKAVTTQAEVVARIDSLKKEKGQLLEKVEQEEEIITNTLTKKLAQLQREKIDLETTLESEQEFIVNRLQRQLENLRQSQNGGSTTSPGLKKYSIHTPPTNMEPPNISPGLIEVMRADNHAIRLKMQDIEREYEENASAAREQYTKVLGELIDLRAKLSITDGPAHPPSILPNLPTVVPGSPGFTGMQHLGGGMVGSLASLERRSRGSLVGPNSTQPDLHWRNDRGDGKSRSLSRGSLIGI